jgi:phage regulator Rha-like protein
MFQLTKEEKDELVPIWHRFKSLKHSSSNPYAFTEHGVAMLASVLNSDKAIKISIFIIKIFMKLRKIIATHKDFASKLTELERKIQSHDEDIITIFRAIRQLTIEETKPKNRIGFL